MASFDDVAKAGDAVAAIIAAGIIPAGLEMMDKKATNAVEPFVNAGYDLDAEAILLSESDGTPEEVAEEVAEMERVLKAAGSTHCVVSQNEIERLRFWSGRKNAFPAAGRISPDYYCMDGTIPRKNLSDMLLAIEAMEKKYTLRCMNVFHAGDGNLHPLILFDANCPGEWERADRFGADILELCVKLGGTITGEHGVGHREDQFDVRAVFGDARARCVLRGEARLRRVRPAQSRQGDPHAASLRRIRPHARAQRRRCRSPICRGSDRMH